jgi:predicted Fe-Mo cluster-binding NifX family protein
MMIRALGADVVLSGGMGPRAIQMFAQHGIEVATGARGTVRDTVDAYLAGTLHGTTPCEDHGTDDCEGHHD